MELMRIFTLPCWPLLLISIAMIVAAVIDAWKFRVPNWLTLPMIVSGWLLAAAYGLGWLPPAPGTPSVESGWERVQGSFLLTGIAFATLGLFWLVSAMGAGDVKMQMGFAAWIGAFFGPHIAQDLFVGGFVVGVLVGGIIGLVEITIFREWGKSWQHLREFFSDLIYAGSLREIQARAKERKTRQRLVPYGVPLCIGFLAYLFYFMSV